MHIVINNRNRLSTTKKMVDTLLRLNENEQIIIIDNGSTYPPLLEWYKEMQHKIDIRMLKNEGHLALWANRIEKELGEYFVYTDSDLELPEDFPKDWKDRMFDVLFSHPNYIKVALAIRIDDIPDHYRYKNQVIRNEGAWWLNEIEQGIFDADTDTTFFLIKNTGDNTYRSLRIAAPEMTCRHIPWYIDLNNLDEEEKYYLENHDMFFLTQYTKQHIEIEKYSDF